jgi:hypothetical protein
MYFIWGERGCEEEEEKTPTAIFSYDCMMIMSSLHKLQYWYNDANWDTYLQYRYNDANWNTLLSLKHLFLYL